TRSSTGNRGCSATARCSRIRGWRIGWIDPNGSAERFEPAKLVVVIIRIKNTNTIRYAVYLRHVAPPQPHRVGKTERIIRHIRIPIKRLPIEGIRHRRVRRHEAAERRVIDTGIEIDEAAGGHLLLVGEALGGGR